MNTIVAIAVSLVAGVGIGAAAMSVAVTFNRAPLETFCVQSPPPPRDNPFAFHKMPTTGRGF